MKQIFKLSFILLAMLCLNAQLVGAKKSNKVYYVVVGSYSNINNAIKEAKSWSGKQPSVYKTTVKGKVYYRVCPSSFSTNAKAKSYIANNGIDGWVWPSTGTASCVWSPGNSNSNAGGIPNNSPKASTSSSNSYKSMPWIQGNWKYRAVIYGSVHEMRVGIHEDYITVLTDGQMDYSGPYKIDGNHIRYGKEYMFYIVIDHNAQRLKISDNGNDYLQRF